jgi:hypothetical protein
MFVSGVMESSVMKMSQFFSLALGAAVELGLFFGQATERAFEKVPVHADDVVVG